MTPLPDLDEQIEVYEITPHPESRYDYAVIECKNRSYAAALAVVTRVAEELLNEMECGEAAKEIKIRLVKMSRQEFEDMHDD